MAFDLKSIQVSTQLPPRLVIYGVPGIGKTTLAAQATAPIFLPVEDGLGQLEVPAFPRPKSFDEVLDAVEALMSEDHPYQTLVIDSLDKLEPLVWGHVLTNVPHEKGHAAKRIEEYGFGKGYTHALTEWGKLTEGLDVLREEYKMSTILIAHSSIVRFESPDTDTYERYQLALNKKADAHVRDWADAVLFANYEVATVARDGHSDKRRGVGKGERSLFTTERPAFTAKNRYAMPDKLPLDWTAVEEFLTQPQPQGE